MNLSAIGLAFRARKIVIGTDMTLAYLPKNKVYLIILATDASLATKKKIYDKAKTYQVDVLEVVSSQQLSQALGKFGIKVIGVMDQGFSQLLLK
ncbi:MAG: ribosomal L7Ae/L30e/S12e/Gadd45 family protein [Acholeplasmataceae bacterium]